MKLLEYCEDKDTIVMYRIFVLFLGMMVSCIACFGQSLSAVPIDICTLYKNVNIYKEQRVKARAFLGVGFENIALYDPKCQNGEPLIDIVFKSHVQEEWKGISRRINDKGFACVVIEGIVHGPEPMPRDPKLPDWINDLYKNSMKKYGHMNVYEMQIEVEHMEMEDDDRCG